MNQDHNPNRDHEVPQPPSDGISCLAWSSKNNYLIAGSWDSQVRCWEVQSSYSGITSMPKAAAPHEAPVLCTSWKGDGTQVFSGGCDNKVRCWNLQTNSTTVVAQHAAPVKTSIWIEDVQMLQTGSWDKTIKYWDVRQQTGNPTLSVPLTERVYSADVKFPLSIVATAEKTIVIYDLRKPNVEFKKMPSPLKFQTRVVSCFPDKTGFAIGSIEGRVGIHHIEDRDQSKNFAFKCHREDFSAAGKIGTGGSKPPVEIYSVNVFTFHPVHGTFATAGSDGAFNFWDKDSKQRLKQFSRSNAPITAGCFNQDGQMFAYSVSYDWSKGIEGYSPQTQKNYVLIHAAVDAETKPKARR